MIVLRTIGPTYFALAAFFAAVLCHRCFTRWPKNIWLFGTGIAVLAAALWPLSIVGSFIWQAVEQHREPTQ